MLRYQRVLEYYVLLNDIRHKKCCQPIWRRRVEWFYYSTILLESLQVLVRMMKSWRKGGEVNNEGLILSMSQWRKDDEGGPPSSGGATCPLKSESPLCCNETALLWVSTRIWRKVLKVSTAGWAKVLKGHIYMWSAGSCCWWTSCLEPRKSCIVAPPLPL